MPDMNDSRVGMLRYFSNIAGYNGVFIGGDYPNWLFLTGRGELRAHPMNIDGPVKSFAAFNNVNCPQGFLYFNKKVLISKKKVYKFISCLNFTNVIGRIKNLCVAYTSFL